MGSLAGVLAVVLLSACTTPTPTPAAESTETAMPLPAPTVLQGQIRPSVLSGSWYPSDPNELAQMVDEMLAVVRPVDGAPVAL